MAQIEWKTQEEIQAEQSQKPPTIEELQAKLEKLEEEKRMTDLTLLELVEKILG